MVLEHLFPEDWLEKKIRYAFLIAVIYSTVSIIVARMLFAGNSGLVAVVFTSILLLPYLQKLFYKEEIKELHEQGGFKIKTFLKDNLPAIKVYSALFLGIYFTFMVYSFLLPLMGFDTGSIFREQLAIEANMSGDASFSAGLFETIFVNNWWVLLACFLLALLTGDGAVFFIAWNASTWGAIFGARALNASIAGVGDPVSNLAVITSITFPHLVLEGGAYILAAIAGSVISETVVSRSQDMPNFLTYFFIAILSFIILAVIVQVLGLPSLVNTILYILIACLLLRLIAQSFTDANHRKVFAYNVWLFYIAIALFFVGVVVETFVLSNSSLLMNVYHAALYS